MRLRIVRWMALTLCVAVLGLGGANAKAAAKSAKNASAARSSGKKSSKRRHHRARRNWRAHGQQAMKPDRIREIQGALIREKYLQGAANGVWDSNTKQAMARYQEENGWQNKRMPDSRALIKLGLGATQASAAADSMPLEGMEEPALGDPPLAGDSPPPSEDPAVETQ